MRIKMYSRLMFVKVPWLWPTGNPEIDRGTSIKDIMAMYEDDLDMWSDISKVRLYSNLYEDKEKFSDDRTINFYDQIFERSYNANDGILKAMDEVVTNPNIEDFKIPEQCGRILKVKKNGVNILSDTDTKEGYEFMKILEHNSVFICPRFCYDHASNKPYALRNLALCLGRIDNRILFI